MATCLEIISYAMRMARVLGAGKEPKGAESDDGMVALQSLYDQWRTGGMFGELTDVYLDDDDTAEEGMRYYVPDAYTLTAATSVYDDNGETRIPRDLSLYEAFNDEGEMTAARLFDRTQWVDLIDLETADTAPLSNRNAYGLAACLATSGGFVAMFGAQPSDATIALARHFLRNVMSKSTTQDRDGATYF